MAIWAMYQFAVSCVPFYENLSVFVCHLIEYGKSNVKCNTADHWEILGVVRGVSVVYLDELCRLWTPTIPPPLGPCPPDAHTREKIRSN